MADLQQLNNNNHQSHMSSLETKYPSIEAQQQPNQSDLNRNEPLNIAVIGLGYVGLPLAVEFGKHCSVTGFDINDQRIGELNLGTDHTLDVSDEELADSRYLSFSSKSLAIEDCNFYIVTVPTPIDEFKQPDLTPLIKASNSIGKLLKKGDIVVYESTVYPGVTEDICVPILEKESGLKFNVDFFAGYSPERINPGDKVHTVTQILKVTSGSTPEIAIKVDTAHIDWSCRINIVIDIDDLSFIINAWHRTDLG